MDMFDVVSLLPLVLAFFGARYLVKLTKSSGWKRSRGVTAAIWAMAIALPLLSGELFARLLAGSDLPSSIPHWVSMQGGFTTLVGGNNWGPPTYLVAVLVNHGWQVESAMWVVALVSTALGILIGVLLLTVLWRIVPQKIRGGR